VLSAKKFRSWGGRGVHGNQRLNSSKASSPTVRPRPISQDGIKNQSTSVKQRIVRNEENNKTGSNARERIRSWPAKIRLSKGKRGFWSGPQERKKRSLKRSEHKRHRGPQLKRFNQRRKGDDATGQEKETKGKEKTDQLIVDFHNRVRYTHKARGEGEVRLFS